MDSCLVRTQAPAAGKVGLMYMLEGGTDASNTDPYADKPGTENHWDQDRPARHGGGADATFTVSILRPVTRTPAPLI